MGCTSLVMGGAAQLSSRRWRPGRPPGLRFWARFLWLSCVAAAATLLAGATLAATFQTTDGKRLEGEVVHATRNTIMVQEKLGGIQQLSLKDIESVEARTPEGKIVTGVLLGWKDGVYEIESSERRIKLGDGRAVGEVELQTPLLVISTAEAAEGASEMRFNIDLSAPARQSIFLVYGTFDRTAKAGEDYQEERGSLEFAPGEQSAVLHVPLIDDDVAEADEFFEMFISADKELATIDSNRVIGTILNDDE